MHIKTAKADLIKMIEATDPKIFATFSFGYKVAQITGQCKINRFCNKVERKLLGRSWHKKPFGDRIRAVFVWEHLDSNPHCHAVIGGPKALLDLNKDELEQMWLADVKRGQLHYEEARSVKRIARYMAKDVWSQNCLSRLELRLPPQN